MFKSGGWVEAMTSQFGFGMPLYNLLYVIGIIFFAYFYTAIIFNPDDVAENMRKYGGFVPGIRPGKRTAEYIDTILTRITLAGAVYLAVIAILPQFLLNGFKVAPIPFIGEWLDAILPQFITEGMNVQFYFGGTSHPDRRRRGDGYRPAGRVPADHAPLRRVHEEVADSRSSGVAARGATRSDGAEPDHAGTARGRKGHPGRAICARPRASESLDRRHPSRCRP